MHRTYLIHACHHTYIRTYIYNTHIHTHNTHTHTHTQFLPLLSLPVPSIGHTSHQPTDSYAVCNATVCQQMTQIAHFYMKTITRLQTYFTLSTDVKLTVQSAEQKFRFLKELLHMVSQRTVRVPSY